jgi:hypothetical protein
MTPRHAKSLRFLGACTSIVATLSVTSPTPPAVGQTPRLRTVAATGLFTLGRGHTANLTLVETGGETAQPQEVILRVRALDDRILAQVRRELAPGEPVRLALPGPSTGSVLFRAEAVLLSSTNNFATAPVFTVEVTNAATGGSFVATTCAVPYDPEGTGGPVIGDCGGCQFLVSFEP